MFISAHKSYTAAEDRRVVGHMLPNLQLCREAAQAVLMDRVNREIVDILGVCLHVQQLLGRAAQVLG